MKTKFIYLILLLASISAFANDPLSVSISGPHKIFTNDQVKFTANVVGANSNACSWSASSVSGSSSGGIYNFTAPSIATVVTIYCSVSIGEGDDQRTAEDSITVTVVEPQIIVYRDSLDLDNPYISPDVGPNIVCLEGDSTTAFLHRNGMEILDEALELSIEITPTDVDIQSFELTTSNTSSLLLYRDDCQLSLPYHKSSITKVSALNEDLEGLHAWGEECGIGYSINLKINNNQKISLNYNIYGIGNHCFSFPSEEDNFDYKDDFPGLVNNEWGYVDQSDIPEYNCLAYAIKNPAVVNSNFFWCNKILPLATNFVYASRFFERQGYDSYITSVDIFGNSNGTLEDSDVDAYFMDPFWGQDKATRVQTGVFIHDFVPSGDMFYYNKFHAARKSTRANGAYSNWNLLESKCGYGHILIHRPQHIRGIVYGNISRIYYK